MATRQSQDRTYAQAGGCIRTDKKIYIVKTLSTAQSTFGPKGRNLLGNQVADF